MIKISSKLKSDLTLVLQQHSWWRRISLLSIIKNQDHSAFKSKSRLVWKRSWGLGDNRLVKVISGQFYRNDYGRRNCYDAIHHLLVRYRPGDYSPHHWSLPQSIYEQSFGKLTTSQILSFFFIDKVRSTYGKAYIWRLCGDCFWQQTLEDFRRHRHDRSTNGVHDGLHRFVEDSYPKHRRDKFVSWDNSHFASLAAKQRTIKKDLGNNLFLRHRPPTRLLPKAVKTKVHFVFWSRMHYNTDGNADLCVYLWWKSCSLATIVLVRKG